eukprot:gene3221-biopygen6130
MAADARLRRAGGGGRSAEAPVSTLCASSSLSPALRAQLCVSRSVCPAQCIQHCVSGSVRPALRVRLGRGRHNARRRCTSLGDANTDTRCSAGRWDSERARAGAMCVRLDACARLCLCALPRARAAVCPRPRARPPARPPALARGRAHAGMCAEFHSFLGGVFQPYGVVHMTPVIGARRLCAGARAPRLRLRALRREGEDDVRVVGGDGRARVGADALPHRPRRRRREGWPRGRAPEPATEGADTSRHWREGSLIRFGHPSLRVPEIAQVGAHRAPSDGDHPFRDIDGQRLMETNVSRPWRPPCFREELRGTPNGPSARLDDSALPTFVSFPER